MSLKFNTTMIKMEKLPIVEPPEAWDKNLVKGICEPSTAKAEVNIWPFLRLIEDAESRGVRGVNVGYSALSIDEATALQELGVPD